MVLALIAIVYIVMSMYITWLERKQMQYAMQEVIEDVAILD